jgi:hypothetical protein
MYTLKLSKTKCFPQNFHTSTFSEVFLETSLMLEAIKISTITFSFIASEIFCNPQPIVYTYMLQVCAKDTRLEELKIEYVLKKENPPNVSQIRPIEHFWANLKKKIHSNNYTAQQKTGNFLSAS